MSLVWQDNSAANILTAVSPQLDLLKQKYDADEDPHILIIRYSYYRLVVTLHVTITTATVVELLAKRALYRTLARIRRMQSGDAPLETPTALPSPVTRLPQDVVELIISYLTYDIRSLRAHAP